MDLKGRNFLTLKDFTAEEIIYLVDLAAELKEKKKKGIFKKFYSLFFSKENHAILKQKGKKGGGAACISSASRGLRAPEKRRWPKS